MPDTTPLNVPTLTLSGGTRISKALTRGQPFTVGSEGSAHFRIRHPSLAPRHLVLLWDGVRTRITEADQERGVLLNSKPTSAAPLQDGDTLRIGDFEFLFRAATATNTESWLVRIGGKEVEEVPVSEGLTFGYGEQATVRLSDANLSSIHAVIEKSEGGFTIVDKGGYGLLANGRFFERHLLLIGDRIDFGEHYAFIFDGFALYRSTLPAGCALAAQHLEVQSAQRSLVRDVGFVAPASGFAGIIGPSGAGKSTILRALAGITRLAYGRVLLNRTDTASLDDASSCFGYVPQQDIVHLELSGRQALRYAAALRLPARTPAVEVEKLIAHLAGKLGLTQHLDKPAHQLSGGQLKRLSVAVELLRRPPVLLLDEPTSGLDPESETLLMRQLRELTASGCTVVCTTHLMENIHLMDHLEVVVAAPEHGEAGTSVFRGKPSAAREFFKAANMADIYPRLREQLPSAWRKRFEEQSGHNAGSPEAQSAASTPPQAPRLRRRAALPILLKRQWEILRSDVKNIALLVGQPLLIGILIALAAASAKDHSATKLFLACISAFWMACGNAAPDLVRERAIFERERFAGLRVGTYLSAKFVWLWSSSLLQSILLFLVLKIFGGLKGAMLWQVTALAGSSLAATGIGLLISAWSRTVLQAVLLVPVATIPQILFSGYVFKLQDWNDQPLPRIISRAFPGFASQRIVDTSMLWGQRIGNYSDMDEAGLITSYENLCTALYPTRAWLGIGSPDVFTVDETQLYSEAPRKAPLKIRELKWDSKNPPSMRLGAIYAWTTPASQGLLLLTLWATIGGAGAYIILRRREG